MLSETIYKKDSTGKIRSWQGEVEGSQWRTHTGVVGGKIVTTNWTDSVAASQDTDEEQALFEMNAEKAKKLDRGYFPTIAEAEASELISPMLAVGIDKIKELVFPVYVQPKLEGIRCLASKDSTVTREGKDHEAIPHIIDALKPFFEQFPDVILDGELYSHHLKHDFEKTCSFVKKQKPTAGDLELSERNIQFHVYDIIEKESEFQHRTVALENLIGIIHSLHPNNARYIHYVPTHFMVSQDDVDALYDQLVEKEGYEGLMLRTPRSQYQMKRTKDLIKMKKMITAEFRVADIEEGKGNWKGRAKRVICELPDGRTFGSGLRGDFDFTKALLADKESFIGSLVTIRFQNYTADGIPRIPVVIEWHGAERNF